MSYEHTQKGKLHLILYLGALFLLVFAMLAEPYVVSTCGLYIAALICLLLGLSVNTLTVKDNGDSLRIISGPIPIFRKDIPYSEIKDIKISKSSILDGWGMHYSIGKGWIINIWGFDCISLRIGKRKFRIGTDDKEGLFEFLKQKNEKNSA